MHTTHRDIARKALHEAALADAREAALAIEPALTTLSFTCNPEHSSWGDHFEANAFVSNALVDGRWVSSRLSETIKEAVEPILFDSPMYDEMCEGGDVYLLGSESDAERSIDDQRWVDAFDDAIAQRLYSIDAIVGSRIEDGVLVADGVVQNGRFNPLVPDAVFDIFASLPGEPVIEPHIFFRADADGLDRVVDAVDLRAARDALGRAFEDKYHGFCVVTGYQHETFTGRQAANGNYASMTLDEVYEFGYTDRAALTALGALMF